jgi:hypothetical protein
MDLPEKLPRMSVERPEDKLRPRPKEKDGESDLAARPPAGGGGGGAPGFQEQKIRRAVEGTITQKGVTALDVEATPLGRYLQVVSKVVSRDWQRACRRNENLVHIQPGFIRVNFVISKDGKIGLARALEVRDASETQKWFTLRAIKAAKLPPIPPEVVELLEDGHLEVNFNFLFFL